MKGKEQKGITLVALVITIVVLLILAGVVLSAMQKIGIIGKAGESKEKYGQASINEETTLDEYGKVMNAYINDNSDKNIEWAYDEGDDGIFYIDSSKKQINLTSNNVKAQNYIWDEENNEPVYSGIITIDLTKPRYVSFYNNSTVEYINLNGLAIKDVDFINCSELKTVEGLEGILITRWINMFNNCSSLNKIDIPNNINEIGYRCFGNCTSLTEIVIPSNVEIISGGAFYGCTNLNNITIKKPQGSIDLSLSGLTDEQIANIKWEK